MIAQDAETGDILNTFIAVLLQLVKAVQYMKKKSKKQKLKKKNSHAAAGQSCDHMH